MEQSQLFNKGILSQEAADLLKQYGYNEISDVKQFTLIKSIIGQFDNVLILLLIAAGGVSFLLVNDSIACLFFSLLSLMLFLVSIKSLRQKRLFRI